MNVIIKKYGRWNEDCNWQLESRREKEMSEESYKNFKEYAGFTYNPQYKEWYAISEDKLRLTVVIEK